MSSLRSLLRSKKVIIFDLDGTLYLGKKVIPGARALVHKLESEKKWIFYLTNNSSRSESDYIRKLRLMGFPCRKGQVRMSTHLLIWALKKRRWRKLFLLGTPAMKRMLAESGLHVSSKPQVVVVGFDKTLTYLKLEKACRLVQSGVPYVVTHPDLFCPTDRGPEPDCGSFAKVIEVVTHKKPSMILGKPHPLMLRGIQEEGRFRRGQMILVGDRLSTDIQMAKNFGIDSLLVLSGETKRKDLLKSQIKRMNIASSVRDLLW
jgi:NagD protein